MRHQRPSSVSFRKCGGAVSFQAAGSSTRGGCAGGGVAQAVNKTKLLRSMRRMVRRQRVGMGNSARTLDLIAQLVGAAWLAQPARGEQLEEHRHEEDGEEG